MASIDDTRALIRNKLLNWGIATKPIYPGLDIGRDIEFVGGDLAVVEGLDCLAQDLTIALTSGFGIDPFNVNFGFDGLNALAQETDPVLLRERVRISIIKVLKNEPRVRRILDVKLLDGRLDPVEADMSTADAGSPLSRILNVRVAFEAISGDQSVLDSAKVSVNA
jgi:hypothetical protein